MAIGFAGTYKFTAPPMLSSSSLAGMNATAAPSVSSWSGGGTAASAAGGSNMWATILPVAASFLSSLFGNKSQEVQAEKNRQAELQVAQMQDERTKQAQALQESTYDPFRQPMMQMGDVAKLDWLQNANYSPTKIAAPAQYAKYVPQISGGVSYTKSPEMSQYAAMLKALIASGRAPDSVTGVTPGVVDLTGQVPVKAGSSPYNPWAAQVPVGTAVARSRVNRRYAE